MRRKYKNSIAIISIYDKDGIVDEYIIYLIKLLKNVIPRVIVGVNGCLNDSSYAKLHEIVQEIHIRENSGFDFGVYRDIMENYILPSELEECDELVLCNDTCFGPFVSFESIFRKMDQENYEVWSMNYVKDCLLPYLQSYFLVFHDKAIYILKKFLIYEASQEAKNIWEAQGLEYGLNEVLISSGVRYGCYANTNEIEGNIDIYRAPDYAIRCMNFPMLKKKAFDIDFYHENNCLETLRLIQDNTDYPLEYILDVIRRKYNRRYLQKEWNMRHNSKCYFTPDYYTTRERLIGFCKNNEKIYLYGNGYMAIMVLARFGRYMHEFGGYIVSDEYYKEKEIQAENIIPFSAFNQDMMTIVALQEKSSKEVYEKLGFACNILYLSIPNNIWR